MDTNHCRYCTINWPEFVQFMVCRVCGRPCVMEYVEDETLVLTKMQADTFVCDEGRMSEARRWVSNEEKMDELELELWLHDLNKDLEAWNAVD